MRAALSSNSCSSNSMVTSAAAQATGFPPKVEACAPGPHFIRSARAIVAPSGSPLAMPLATVMISGVSWKWLVTIELLEQELLDNAARMGAHLMSRMRDWPARFPIVGEV